MTRNPLSKLLVLASLAGAPIVASADPPADPPPAIEPSSAVQSERSAGTRVAYYAQLTTIAERDMVTAQITLQMAQKQREIAIRKGDDEAANYWETRRRAALTDQADARQRADRFRTERDRARGDFGESAAELRKPRTLG